ncbi:MAG: hypothetical protein M1837_003012 [Sclerophora amabilis]|nr:MAG: hypothetical protein M1837_003012 [Sclerophora amabilis]
MATSKATNAHPPHGQYHRSVSEVDDHNSNLSASRPMPANGQTFPEIPAILPHEKVFPIQIGSELFRLSGASISSDAPSYFSQFFERQIQDDDQEPGSVRTLYIDRDPVTFRDISRHLQGYSIQPRDGGHYVKLFADAQFYNLPRLVSQLFESEIFIRIGHQHFQIPRDIFSSPGDSPNYFSLGFAVFFATPGETFPGLNRDGLLRPPSILPPSVPNRSADVFAELLHLLRGYPLHIRNEEHRAALLRDCRYFHLRGLEQKLIPHHISFNLKRNRSEIVVRLEDIRPSGISFASDTTAADSSSSSGWVNYMRPFVDEESYELILEIGGECTRINFRTMRADFRNQARARISSLFQVIANKMNLPTKQPLGLLMMSGGADSQGVSPGNSPLSGDQVRIHIARDSHILLDGEIYSSNRSEFGADDEIEREDLGPGPGAPGEDGAPSRVQYQSATSTPSVRNGADFPSPGWMQQTQNAQVSRASSSKPPPRKRKRRGSFDDFGEWVVSKGQWRLRLQPSEDANGGMVVIMMAVKIEAFGGEHGRNVQRSFLGL